MTLEAGDRGIFSQNIPKILKSPHSGHDHNIAILDISAPSHLSSWFSQYPNNRLIYVWTIFV